MTSESGGLREVTEVGVILPMVIDSCFSANVSHFQEWCDQSNYNTFQSSPKEHNLLVTHFENQIHVVGQQHKENNLLVRYF